MKSFYTVLLSSIFTTSLFAQESKLLQNFKYRISNFNAVTLNADAGGGAFKEYFTSSNNNFGSSIGGSYNFFTNTDSRKTIISTYILGALNRGENYSSSTDKNKNSFAGSNIYFNNTWYKAKNYIEIGTTIFGNSGNSSTKNYNNTEIANTKNNSFAFLNTIAVGRGRIENVTDMQNALWLYRSLKKDKNLNRDLTAEELNNLAKSITKSKNTRVLDFRRRTKFVLKTVDGFLQEKGVIGKSDIDYFSTLNDNLFLANNFERLAGSVFYFNINPQIEGRGNAYFDGINSFIQQNNNGIKELSATFGYKKHLPKTLNRQTDFGFAFKTTIAKNTETDKKIYSNNVVLANKSIYNIEQYGPELFYDHGLYPNTRTNINIRADANIGIQVVNNVQDNFANLKLGANINYFINYRTRFIANLGLNYQKNILDYFQRSIFLPNRLFASTKVGIDINL